MITKVFKVCEREGEGDGSSDKRQITTNNMTITFYLKVYKITKDEFKKEVAETQTSVK